MRKGLFFFQYHESIKVKFAAVTSSMNSSELF